MQQITVTRELKPYLEGKQINNPDTLLKVVKKILQDLKKDKPSLEGLKIAELSFLKNERKDLSIKFLFK
jgi:endoglucanase Acf2